MKQLMFFFLLLSYTGFSQTIDLSKYTPIAKIHFLEESEELYIFYRDSLTVIDLVEFKAIRNIKLKNTLKFDDKEFTTVSVDKDLFFVENLGGGVYKLVNDSIIKIDHSFTHKMQVGSSVFNHNDTIYRYGGYGFWSARNFFTYYDNSTSEWELVSPYGSKYLPKGSFSSTVKIDKGDFYIYGGESIDEFEPKKYIINDKVWKFTLPDRAWEFLGKSKIDFTKYPYAISCGKNQIIFNADDDFLYLIDVSNNVIKTYKKPPVFWKLNHPLNSFYKDGVFYLTTLSYSDHSIHLEARNEDELFVELIEESPFYYNHENIYYGILLLFLLSITLVSYLLLKKWHLKKNKIIISDQEMIFKRNRIPFESIPFDVIKLLVRSDNEVLSSDILKITENKNLNYSHNVRVRNTIIDESNFKLKSILGIEDEIITFKKSKLDKRIKVYSIDKRYFYFK